MGFGAKPAAEKNRTETLLQLESDGSFSSWAKGRLAPTDRSLSNSHKSFQRRMLFTDPTIPFPATSVLQLQSTGEIYLVGSSREDAQDDGTYDRLTVLHRVSSITGSSSGLVEYFNYRQELITPLIPSPINIGKFSEGNFYFAIEYTSTKMGEIGDEAYQGKSIVYSPNAAPLMRDGVFALNGKNYKVIQSYYDSEFSCAIVIEQDDDMQPITYHVIDNSTSGYDVTTGALTLSVIDYILPGTVDRTTQDLNGGKDFQVFIKLKTPPITLSSGNNLTLADGSKCKIVSVTEDVNTQGQFRLLCEGG